MQNNVDSSIHEDGVYDFDDGCFSSKNISNKANFTTILLAMMIILK